MANLYKLCAIFFLSYDHNFVFATLIFWFLSSLIFHNSFFRNYCLVGGYF